MVTMRFARPAHTGALLFGVLTSLLVGSCGSEDKSGACTGEMNGAYFRLEIGNYLVDAGIDVRINGRFIGSVGRGKIQPGTQDQIEATVKRLGEFPVCDKMVVDARGNNGTYSQKICSRPAFLSPACSGGANDFCWVTLSLVPGEPCDNCVFFPNAQPPCPCGYAGGPGDAWEDC